MPGHFLRADERFAVSKPLKKVLIVYASRPPIIEDLSAALARQGIVTDYLLADESHWFDRWIIRRVNKQLHNFRILPKNKVLFAEHPLAHVNYRSNRLSAKVAEFQPDLVLLVRGINFNHDVLARIPHLFGWWVEREERTGEALRELKYFDWYFFISRASVEQAKAAGFANTSYQSHVVNLERFCRLEDAPKQFDVCFVGNWSPHRQSFLKSVLEVTPNVAIYGRKWRRNNLSSPGILKAVKGNWIEGEALNALYNRSRVVLNVTNWGAGSGKARSGMNMRVFEVPASGAFLLTDESREMEEFLVPGQDIGVYNGLDELKTALRRALTSEHERERIADRGCMHVREHFTYDAMAENLIRAWKSVEEKANAG